MLKNFLRLTSVEERRQSTFASKIDRSGREANVACVVAVAVSEQCVVNKRARRSFFFWKILQKEIPIFRSDYTFELLFATAIACVLPYLLKVFVCFELFRTSLLIADLN